MRGFTLIEVLIYLALFSILMTGVVASMFSLKSGAERIEASARLTNEGHYLLGRVGYAIEQSGKPNVGRFVVVRGILEDDESPLNSSSSPVSDWGVAVTEGGGVDISFLLTVYTAGGNPLSSVFSGTFFPLQAL